MCVCMCVSVCTCRGVSAGVYVQARACRCVCAAQGSPYCLIRCLSLRSPVCVCMCMCRSVHAGACVQVHACVQVRACRCVRAGVYVQPRGVLTVSSDFSSPGPRGATSLAHRHHRARTPAWILFSEHRAGRGIGHQGNQRSRPRGSREAPAHPPLTASSAVCRHVRRQSMFCEVTRRKVVLTVRPGLPAPRGGRRSRTVSWVGPRGHRHRMQHQPELCFPTSVPSDVISRPVSNCHSTQPCACCCPLK